MSLLYACGDDATSNLAVDAGTDADTHALDDAAGIDLGVCDCGEGEQCLENLCVTDSQATQANAVRNYVAALRRDTGTSAPLDWDALANSQAHAVLAGDGSDGIFFHALRAVHLAVPQGHQQLLFPDCGTRNGIPYAQSTWYAVCGRPSAGGVVVTAAADANPLELHPGDLIVSSSRFGSGAGLLPAAAEEPVCASSAPSDSARAEMAAASFFGVIRDGDVLTVRAPDGTQREVTVAHRSTGYGWCFSPLGGYDDFEIRVTMRDDGIAVIRVPGFLSSEHPLPEPLTDASYARWVDDYIERIRVAIQPALGARAIIWDARGNTGGAQEIPLAIVAGMQGAEPGLVSRSYRRISGSDPFAFATTPVEGFDFSVVPGGPLAYTGVSIVLVDGLTYSAGDIFAAAAKQFGHARLVGRPSAGAFGYGANAGRTLSGARDIQFTVDGFHSVNAAGEPIEGHSITPDIFVEYSQSDLASGVDTVLEAAIAAVD